MDWRPDPGIAANGAPRMKLATTSVEFAMTEHCNLGCAMCSNASPLLPTKFASLDEFVSDFESLAGVLHARELRIVGGEPLLHPQLVEFVQEARRIGIADAIVLFTNGVLLHQASERLFEAIDTLRISIYPGVHRRLDDEECRRLCAAHGVALELVPTPEFQRTLINNRIDDNALVQAIFDECKTVHEWSCRSVYEGRFYRCSVAAFTRQRLALRGCDFDNRAIDGVPLHGNPNLREDVDACLQSRAPLAACSYCLGTSGPTLPHRQLNRSGRVRWLQEDNSTDIQDVARKLLDHGH